MALKGSLSFWTARWFVASLLAAAIAAPAADPAFDAELARSVGADERGTKT